MQGARAVTTRPMPCSICEYGWRGHTRPSAHYRIRASRTWNTWLPVQPALVSIADSATGPATRTRLNLPVPNALRHHSTVRRICHGWRTGRTSIIHMRYLVASFSHHSHMKDFLADDIRRAWRMEKMHAAWFKVAVKTATPGATHTQRRYEARTHRNDAKGPATSAGSLQYRFPPAASSRTHRRIPRTPTLARLLDARERCRAHAGAGHWLGPQSAAAAHPGFVALPGSLWRGLPGRELQATRPTVHGKQRA